MTSFDRNTDVETLTQKIKQALLVMGFANETVEKVLGE